MKLDIAKIVLLGLAQLLLSQIASAESGAKLVWENRDPSAYFGEPEALDAGSGVAVSVGFLSSNFALTSRDWFVRAYDLRTGVRLWEDRIDQGLRDEAHAVAVQGGRAFVVGDVQSGTVSYCKSDFYIRAYEVHSGALLWDKRYSCGSGNSVSADGRQVFVVGSRLDPSTLQQTGAVSALDARTGTVQWQVKTASSFDPVLFPSRSATDSGITVSGNRVYVAGQMSGFGANGLTAGMYVQAFDRDSGQQLWRYDIRNSESLPITNVVPIAVAGNVLAVGGGVANGAAGVGLGYRVTALDGRSGTLLWTDQVNRQELGLASALGFGGGKLFAYGWDCDQYVSNCHGDVRAYDPQSGALQWENRFTGPGGDIAIPVPLPAFSVAGNHVYLGTALLNLTGDEYEWTVRAYEGGSGSILWQNQIYDGGGYGDGIQGLKVLDENLYASGYVDRPDGGFDFTVRAYQLDQ